MLSKKWTDRIIPDIIIHERNTDKNNLLVIEMKKEDDDNCDIKKLKGLTYQNGVFKYKLGLFIKFDPQYKPILMWFEDGREIDLWLNGWSKNKICCLYIISVMPNHSIYNQKIQ